MKTKKDFLKTLSGRDLFLFYTDQGGEYSQVLLQAYLEIGDDLYPLLEQAEKEDKKIVIVETMDDVEDPTIDVQIK